VDLRDVILSTLRKQTWLSEYLQAIGADPVEFVGSVTASTAPQLVARSISDALELPEPNDRPRNVETFLRFLVRRSESAGINVLRSGIVGTNTRRVPDVDEFRGFSLSDQFALFVFINGTDVKVAQIFTLIHELGHIWLGESGISDILSSGEVFGGTSHESICNRIAAEVLVPSRDFLESWDADEELAETIKSAARQFHEKRGRYPPWMWRCRERDATRCDPIRMRCWLNQIAAYSMGSELRVRHRQVRLTNQTSKHEKRSWG
jgi:Zn-dependent peptidase ImmA (M78 family)